MKSAYLVGALSLALVLPSQMSAAERQTLTLYRKAIDIHGCGETWMTSQSADSCRQKIAAYKAAEAASDATAPEKEQMQRERLALESEYIGVLRLSGKKPEARQQLQKSMAELDRASPADKAPIARVVAIDLYRQAALLAFAAGDTRAADQAIDQFRNLSQGFFGAVDSMKDNKKLMLTQQNNAIAAAGFEMEVGKIYADQLKAAGNKASSEVREKAVMAYQRARQWAIARAQHNWNGFAQATPQVQFADATLALAQIAKDANDMAGLASAIGEAKAAVCNRPNTNDKYGDSEAEDRCLQTIVMEGWVTGANQELIRRVAENGDKSFRDAMESLRNKKK